MPCIIVSSIHRQQIVISPLFINDSETFFEKIDNVKVSLTLILLASFTSPNLIKKIIDSCFSISKTILIDFSMMSEIETRLKKCSICKY
jgi:hypothetical protein